jgi:hypothetical protein
MKKKTITKLIQGPLRFHHQDIHQELDEIKGMIEDVKSQMQKLQCRTRVEQQTTGMWLSEHDDHKE